MFGKLALGFLQTIQQPLVYVATRPLSILTSIRTEIPNNIAGGTWSLIPVRNKVRNNWPRPRETKRVKLFSYKKRMSTLSGRKIIMRKILRGCSVLTH